MQTDNLVKMANQIASFYTSYADQEAGVAGVASHITRFWEPRMRRELIAYVEGGGQGLVPLATAAARRLAPVAPAAERT